ncbi:MAG: hypothetical protein IJL92_01700 [Thermoguttaceae bacterium]|nr:hypothetical protein [Thermoguttaceae bacterium]
MQYVKLGATGVDVSKLCLGCMSFGKPCITAPIVGFTSPSHVTEAVAALDVKLSDEEIKALEAPYVPHVKTGAF